MMRDSMKLATHDGVDKPSLSRQLPGHTNSKNFKQLKKNVCACVGLPHVFLVFWFFVQIALRSRSLTLQNIKILISIKK